MTKTLNNNYSKNLKIMAINLNKGMTYDMAMSIIDGQKNQFIGANLYDEEANNYINDLTAVVLSHFSKMDISVVNFKDQKNG